MSDVRTEMVTIRLTPEERRRAQAVAEFYALNIAGLFRMLVKRESRAVGEDGDASPAKKSD